ncbi:MAG TPA: O-antigen ligase family protein [Actinomycetota bacterium]
MDFRATSSGWSTAGLAATLTAGSLMQGAFYVSQLVLTVTIAGICWIASAAGSDARAHAPRMVLVGFGLLFAGLAIASAVNGFPAESGKPALTLLLCVLVYSLAARAAASDGPALVLDLVVAIAAIAIAAGLIGVAFHLRLWAFPAGSWRLTSTLTYQNAAAAVCAIALPVALARGERRWTRAATVVLVAGLVATQSRGGVVAALAGAAIIAFLRPVPDLARLTFGVLLATASIIPALAGMPFAAIIAVPGMVAGAALAAKRSPEEHAQSRAWWPAVAAAAAVVATLVTTTPVSDRFSATSNDRGRVWAATLDAIKDDPAFGTGPGTFEIRRVVDGVPVRTLHAHNEYLQAAAETGLVGLALAVAGIAAFAAGLIRSMRAHSPAAVAALASATAFLIHSAVDFLWRIPILPAMCFALLAAGLTSTEARSSESP